MNFVLICQILTFLTVTATIPPQYGCQSVTCDKLQGAVDQPGGFISLSQFNGIEWIDGSDRGGGYYVYVTECISALDGSQCTECNYKQINTTLMCM